MNIAICDDCKYDRSYIKNILNMCCTKKNYCYTIYEYCSGEDLIIHYKKGLYNIIFIDIFMYCLNGIKTAEEILKIDPDCCIVFITCSKEFALDAFHVGAINYLVKPFSKEEILESLLRYEKFYSGFHKYLNIEINGISQIIRQKSIYYIEVQSNYCYIHLENKIYKCRITLKDIIDKLYDSPNFIQTHKSYMVNSEYIFHFEKHNIILNNNVIIPVSRSFEKHFKDNFNNYINSKL